MNTALAVNKMASEINIDVSAVTSKSELHELLAVTLGSPDYYGMNWDAFDECIRDYAPRASIRVTGISNLKNHLQRESQFANSYTKCDILFIRRGEL